MSDYANNFSRYVNYNAWANKAITDFLANKPEHLLDKEIISSFPSIRKTIFHIADGQFIWLSRLKGNSPVDWPSKKMHPAEAIPALMNTSLAYQSYCEEKTDAFWNEIITFKAFDGTEYKETVGNITMHLMNHGTFHRGQLITMFRQVGFEGKMPRTDLIVYLREIATK